MLRNLQYRNTRYDEAARRLQCDGLEPNENGAWERFSNSLLLDFIKFRVLHSLFPKEALARVKERKSCLSIFTCPNCLVCTSFFFNRIFYLFRDRIYQCFQIAWPGWPYIACVSASEEDLSTKILDLGIPELTFCSSFGLISLQHRWILGKPISKHSVSGAIKSLSSKLDLQ